MKKMSKAAKKLQLTDWLPSSVKPALPGWYNVKCDGNTSRFETGAGDDGRINGMRFWDGLDWRFVPQGGLTNFGQVRHCRDFWRGLASDPSKGA